MPWFNLIASADPPNRAGTGIEMKVPGEGRDASISLGREQESASNISIKRNALVWRQDSALSRSSRTSMIFSWSKGPLTRLLAWAQDVSEGSAGLGCVCVCFWFIYIITWCGNVSPQWPSVLAFPFFETLRAQLLSGPVYQHQTQAAHILHKAEQL